MLIELLPKTFCRSCNADIDPGLFFCKVCGRFRWLIYGKGFKRWEILLVSFLATFLILGLYGFISFKVTPQVSVTQPSPTSKPYPNKIVIFTPSPTISTLTPMPTSTPKIATSEPVLSSQSSSPEQFIRSYFNTLKNRNYESAWSMLSAKFQSNHTYSEYSSWWETIDKVEILSMNVKSQNDSEAYVYVEAHYYYKSGDVTTGHTTYKLIKNGSSWLFDPN